MHWVLIWFIAVLLSRVRYQKELKQWKAALDLYGESQHSITVPNKENVDLAVVTSANDAIAQAEKVTKEALDNLDINVCEKQQPPYSTHLFYAHHFDVQPGKSVR